ncbi:MAG: class I SAM-dependent methyltransferase [Pseudomonadota bacterium]|nr:class I SAM-dependent methyltransferase [Pseudomonadota bacterium]
MNRPSAVPAFADHFSSAAADFAAARPAYPPDLFAWIGAIAPAHARVWEAGCGSGQASRDLAKVFSEVFATDPSAEQIAQAHAPINVSFAAEPAEHCSLADASVDAVCVAKALHWFDRDAFFAAVAGAWGDAGTCLQLQWPLFVHARRK